MSLREHLSAATALNGGASVVRLCVADFVHMKAVLPTWS
jgi:hypothetical protein